MFIGFGVFLEDYSWLDSTHLFSPKILTGENDQSISSFTFDPAAGTVQPSNCYLITVFFKESEFHWLLLPGQGFSQTVRKDDNARAVIMPGGDWPG